MKSILLAEDNRSLSMMLNMMLSEQYEVTSVDNSAALEHELLTNAFDLVISDLNLQGRSTPSVLAKVSSLIGTAANSKRGVPTLVVTGMDEDSPEVIRVKRMADVVGVLRKPLDFVKLKKQVDEILQEQEQPLDANLSQAVANLPRVLVIDDNEDSREFMYNLLDSDDIESRACANAEEAARLCRQIDFDVIVLDYVLEDRVATDVLPDLPASTRYHQPPPVLIVTGFNDQVSLSKFKAFPNVKQVLGKPFHPQEFLDSVRALVAESKTKGHLADMLKQGCTTPISALTNESKIYNSGPVTRQLQVA